MNTATLLNRKTLKSAADVPWTMELKLKLRKAIAFALAGTILAVATVAYRVEVSTWLRERFSFDRTTLIYNEAGLDDGHTYYVLTNFGYIRGIVPERVNDLQAAINLQEFRKLEGRPAKITALIETEVVPVGKSRPTK